jgi:transposase
LDTRSTFGVFFMARHDEKFKKALVQAYLSGYGGYKALGSRHEVSPSLVRQWVRLYRQHGDAGLCSKYSHYSAHFKLTVLQRMHQQELSFAQTAELFDLRGGAGVVSSWERCYHEGGLESLEPKPRGRPAKMKAPKKLNTPKAHDPDSGQAQEQSTLEELRRENEYLRAEVAYLKKLDALVRAQKHPTPKKRKS